MDCIGVTETVWSLDTTSVLLDTDTRFNWATFTASVSCVPAATPVIWRVSPLATSPTDTAAMVDFHVPVVSALWENPVTSYPTFPLSVDATDLLPMATESEI